MLVRDILFQEKRYYGDFLESGEGISTNILADRLTKFEKTGIVTRHQDNIKRSKIFYLPTAKALELIPIFLSIIDWAERHDQNTEVPKDFIKVYRSDPVAFIDKAQQEILELNSRLSGANERN